MEPNEKAESIEEENEKIEEHSPGPTPADTKLTELWEACKWKDVDKLRDFAISEGGLLKDEIRRQAWPILLGCEDTGDVKQTQGDWKALPKHRDEDQVQLDVDRSFIYYPHGTSFPPSHLTRTLISLHRPILSRASPTQSRAIRPDNRGSAATALSLVFSGLPRHLPSLPARPRATGQRACVSTSLSPANKGLHATDLQAGVGPVATHTRHHTDGFA